MTIGEKIRHIRNLRKITQAELGKMVHLSGDRIRQYENNVRTPKLDKITEIAHALDVDVSALSDIDITSTLDIMHILFELEDSMGLQIEKSKNGYSFSFDNDSNLGQELNQFLDTWYHAKEQATPKLNDSTEAINTKRKQYQLWKYRFPLDLEINEATQRAKIVQVYQPLLTSLKSDFCPVYTFSDIIHLLTDMLEAKIDVCFSHQTVAPSVMEAIITFRDSQLLQLSNSASMHFAKFILNFEWLDKVGIETRLYSHTINNETYSNYCLTNNQIATLINFMVKVKEQLANGSLNDLLFKLEYEKTTKTFDIPIEDELL